MPVPTATRLGMSSDYMITAPTPTYPFNSNGDPYEDYEMFGHLNEHPVNGVSFRPGSISKSYDFGNQLGGTDMIETLPKIHSRAHSVAPPSYDRRLRATPGPRSQTRMWDEEENYVVDDSAGMPSRNFFRKSYSLPLSRSGRSGGQWRHIKQATGQAGENLLYIEGTVKDHDVKHFPPFGILQPQIKYNKYGQRLLPGRTGSGYRTMSSGANARAKAGFEYWYKEPKSNISQPPPQPFRTISGHQLTTRGVGYHR
ncbi:uncharacterized protein [Watersipora subatra]|uniref:uncharacterized protein n=1 Tax=Watersipora subatra TaxID=2589382 RepID=UPI00355C0478